MSESVGGISYEMTFDTSKLIDGQRKVDQELKKTASSMNGLGDTAKKNTAPLTAMAIAIAGLATGLAAAGVASARAADEMRLFASRVEIASGSVANGAMAMESIIEISRRIRVGTEETAQVFTRLNQSILQMGGNQQDTLKLTELLGKAIKTSGASAVEASAAMLQFGQALGSGVLQGDELKSLMETAPYLMRQLADGIGVPIGQLKALGAEGELTADVVVNAMGRAANQIGVDFENMGQTLDESMTLAADSAGRLNAKLDEQSGISAALTGIVTGLSSLMDTLSDKITGVDKASGELQRKNAIQIWSDHTVKYLSYVVDFVDRTIQGFSIIGTVVSGIGSEVAALAKGDVAGAAKIEQAWFAAASAKRQALMNDKGAGQIAREKLDLGIGLKPSGENKSINPESGFSKLKPTIAAAKDKKSKKSGKSDEEKAAEKQAKQELADAEWLRKESEKIRQKGFEDEMKAEKQTYDAEQAAIKKGQDTAKQVADSQKSPELLAAEEWGAKLAVIEAAQMLDLENQDAYNLAKLNAELEYRDKIKNLNKTEVDDKIKAQSELLQATSSGFDAMAGLVETFAGKQSGAYRAMFAVSKAFSIADAALSIQAGLAKAQSLAFPLNISEYARVAATGAGILSSIKSISYGGGRQYGGGVTTDNFYRGGEVGPEMLMGNSGRNYFIPPENGKVVPTSQLGGGGGVQINIMNSSGADVSASASPDGKIIDIAVTRAVAEVAGQFRNNQGSVWSSAKAGSNIQGRTV